MSYLGCEPVLKQMADRIAALEREHEGLSAACLAFNTRVGTLEREKLQVEHRETLALLERDRLEDELRDARRALVLTNGQASVYAQVQNHSLGSFAADQDFIDKQLALAREQGGENK